MLAEMLGGWLLSAGSP